MPCPPNDGRSGFFYQINVSMPRDLFSVFQNSDLHSFAKQHRLLVETEEPLEVRAALAGGRTEVFMPFCRLSDHEIQAGVRIRHIDVVSHSIKHHVLKREYSTKE